MSTFYQTPKNTNQILCLHLPLMMTGCWVLLQLENTEEDFPLSDLQRCFKMVTMNVSKLLRNDDFI